ncbi:S24 family peptidase [Pseudomonas aeruginosa]|jgi:DNA polymerase V|nr:S24 family peptidase [Pseudomonas aeruginosa]MCS9139143.1 S24 family peptidase [Pseudomonas aeruginosa]MCS9211876.1 S24 family peptidase [Pseudomonas aeruginosa]
MLALTPFADAEDLQATSIDEILRLREPSVYLVRISGDSMQGAGIYDEDLVIVDRAKDARHGDIVIAAVNGEPVCKRLHMRHDQLALFPENSLYPKRYIMEGDDFMIWGVVVHSIRSHGVA